MGFVWKLSKIALRVGLVAGAVKLSIDNDVWSTSNEKGAKLYSQLKEYILPGTIVYTEKLPSTEEVQGQVGGAWNRGVDKVFGAIESAPDSLNTVANRIINNK